VFTQQIRILAARIIAVAAAGALLPLAAPAAHASNREDVEARPARHWMMPVAAQQQLAAASTGTSSDRTSVTRHEMNTFEFPMPCLGAGSRLYDVTTTSDVTVTVHKTLKTDGRHTEMILGFTDTGTYKARPRHGGPVLTGWFFDTYTTVAIDPRTDSSGAVTTATHFTNNRVLVLTTGTTQELFRETVAADTGNYNAATSPVTDVVTCARTAPSQH
jgi:hypothetical protein